MSQTDQNMEMDLLSEIRRILSGRADAEEKRMFGGTAFFLNGHMCVTARKSRLMVRIAPELHDELIGSSPGAETVTMGGRTYTGWIWIDSATFHHPADLKRWIDLALDFNATLPPK